MKQKMVIGVAGMPGAGKASVKMMAESMGYSTVVMGDEIREETRRRGLELTPENVGKIMIKLRDEEGAAAVARRCVPKIANAKTAVVFVDGIRSLHEVDEFKRHFSKFRLIAVHSSPQTRFQRLFKRRRSDAPRSWDVFLKRDLRELSVGQGAVVALADFMIVNEGTLEELKAKVLQVLKDVTKDE